jgi:hypothetical protein
MAGTLFSLVTGNEIGTFVDFHGSCLHNLNPPRGADVLAVMNESPSLTNRQASQSPLRSVMICQIDSNSGISDT